MANQRISIGFQASPPVALRVPDSELERFNGALGGEGWFDLNGEDGTIQALLDLANIPYSGSGRLASALAMDKDMTKHLFRQHGVQTADWVLVTEGAPIPDGATLAKQLGLPMIVKPSKEGSTVGLSIVREPGAAEAAIREALQFDDEVIVESFVAGRELTVGILGGEALPVGEIIPKNEIYDYEAKYKGGARYHLPPRLSPTRVANVEARALGAYRALGLVLRWPGQVAGGVGPAGDDDRSSGQLRAFERDHLAFAWANEMGRYAPRTRFVELFWKTTVYW